MVGSHTSPDHLAMYDQGKHQGYIDTLPIWKKDSPVGNARWLMGEWLDKTTKIYAPVYWEGESFNLKTPYYPKPPQRWHEILKAQASSPETTNPETTNDDLPEPADAGVYVFVRTFWNPEDVGHIFEVKAGEKRVTSLTGGMLFDFQRFLFDNGYLVRILDGDRVAKKLRKKKKG